MNKDIFYYLFDALDKAIEYNECLDYDVDFDKGIVCADFSKKVLEVNSLSSASEGDNRYRYAVSDILSDYGIHISPKNVTVDFVGDESVGDDFVSVKLDIIHV